MVLAGCIPLGLELTCKPGVLTARGRIWFIPFSIQRKSMNGKAGPLRRWTSNWKNLRILLKNGYTILCRLLSRARVKLFRLHVTAAGPDPANTALLYGAVGLALESIASVCRQRGLCAELRADVDFAGDRPRYDGCMDITVRLYQALGAALRFGWGMMRDYQRLKKGEYERA